MATTSGTRRVATLLAGSGVVVASTYLGYHNQRMELKYEQLKNQQAPDFSFTNNPCRNDTYHRVAPTYDSSVDWDEFYLGIQWLRRILLRTHACGTCLEVGAGTSRNHDHYIYNPKVQRVVLIDSSEQMLQQAKEKIQKSPSTTQFAFRTGNFHEVSKSYPPHAFDTVVDTFGLCSYNDPVAVLNEMNRLCKPNGKILLLEHGQGTLQVVNDYLERHSEQHAAHWGCVWNRNLEEILDHSQVNVEIMSRYHFGTTYYVVCRPTQSADS